MVIDIDAFLQKYSFENQTSKKNLKTEEERLDLSFQKDVEDNINELVKRSENADFQFLKRIYEEVKRFDEDIPSKFLDIEKDGVLAYKNLSGKYSKDFFDNVKKNSGILKENFYKILQELDTFLSGKDFSNIVLKFSNLVKIYNQFPNELFLEKTDLSKELRNREVKINFKLLQYKEKELSEIKTILKTEVGKLKLLMIPGNAKRIEKKMSEIHNYLNSIPKLFLSDISKEKIVISKIMIDCEEFLKKDYQIEFQGKKEGLHNLFDRFHYEIVNKNLKNALALYDEIIFAFQDLPDVFLEEKLDIYHQISELYLSISNLTTSDRISMFMQTYNYSKTFNDVRDYLRLMDMTKKGNPLILSKLKSRILKIPDDYEEKSEFLKKIDSYLDSFSQMQLKLKNDLNLINSNTNNLNTNNLNTNSLNNNSKDYLNDTFEGNNHFSVQNKNSHNDKVKKIDDMLLTDKNLDIEKHYLKEIENYYKKIRLSNNKEEIKIFYKKILFYLNLVKIKENVKKDMLNRLSQVLLLKKID